MPFDPNLAVVISNAFRSAITTRLSDEDRRYFEAMLQAWTGIKNIRNVQLWTRFGTVQRNFINSRLSDRDLDFRLFIAQSFITTGIPNYPTKTHVWSMPPTNDINQKTYNWFNEPFIRAYTHSIYFEGAFFVVRYAASSSTPNSNVDFDSDEFADLVD